MKELTKSRIDLFITNTRKMKGKYIWQNALFKRLAALLYAAENKVIDDDALRESHELIKENTTLFSSFRGNSVMIISALLALHEDRLKQFTDTLTVYQMMKASQFKASDYLVVAAYQIAANTSAGNYSQTIERARAFYDGMKARHFFITGQNDYINASMLGLANVDISSGLERMEQLYQALKPDFRSRNGVQALTQVLALAGEVKDIETHLRDLRIKFRQRGMRIDQEYTLSSLGVLSLLSADGDTLVDDVIETYQYLRTQKGFGRWSISKQELLLFASSLVALEDVNHAKNSIWAAIMTSLIEIGMAQQAAAVAATSG